MAMAEISKEYAAALFMLACERDKKKEYAEALEMVESTISENPEYSEFLSSPGIPMSERLAAIEEAFSAYIPEDVLSYIQLLCERGRISCFCESAAEYQKLLAASEHITEAKITSAAELTEEEKKALKEKLEAMTKSVVNMEYVIDKSLLGGVIAEIDGKVIDGSLRGRLHDMKEVMNR